MATEYEINERAIAISAVDKAVGTLLALTIDDQSVARTLKTCANRLREIQQEAMTDMGHSD